MSIGTDAWLCNGVRRWRGLEYERWTSERDEDDSVDTNFTTRVSHDHIDKLVKRVVHRLCRNAPAS